MKKLIEIKIEIIAPIDSIREDLRKALSVFIKPEVSNLTYRNFDYYNGHWTEYTVIKSAGENVRTESGRLFRKPDCAREDR
ncbi:hypothetical protein KAW50_05045 [candidate division WOR-3 bacterium]|nr:hypothetical protein [candidate division WOR-3 bacterium]